QFLTLMRGNSLFALSVLTILFWTAFVFAWEPATSHYWALLLFPGLLCLGMLARTPGSYALCIFVAVALFISGWNIHFNRENDRDLSINSPEPLLAAIDREVGPRDLLIILVQDGAIGGIDYDLLFTSLQYSTRNPAVSIMEDFVWPAHYAQSWRDNLRSR